ncbi:MAG: FAD-dependent monooxygenase, partial [Woeseiaceae bacterium]|nr:FAD-dependent monooxygenase [Woeseiaceae bacterium]
MAREPIEILGAGLCGSLLAVMLAKRGFPVTVREARPDPRGTQQSAGRSINLALSARGIRALKTAGVMQHVEALLLPMRGRMIHETDGSTELLPYGARDHEVINSVSRAGLNRLLIDVAEREYGVEIRFEHAVTGYDVARAVALLEGPEGGYELPARALLCADGAGSRIRRAYDDGGRIGPTESLLPHGYKELTIPPGKDGGFLLDEAALHIWPRSDFMLIALPNPGGDFTLTLFMPNDGDPGFSSLETEAQVDAFFDEHFADAAALIPELGATFISNPVGILGTVRCRHWHDGD